MTIWKHKDAKITSIGCLGFVCLIIAGIFMIQAFLRSESLSTGVWAIAIVGMGAIGLFMGFLMRSKRRIAGYQRHRNQKANAIRDEVLNNSNPSAPYFVYLRPFDIDEKFVFSPRNAADQNYVEEYGLPTTYHDLESAIALFVHPFGELVALSDEEGKAGAGYVKSTDGTWQEDVKKMCAYAEGIFLVPFDFEGTAWEVEMVVELGFLKKTFFVMPAKSVIHHFFGLKYLSRDYKTLWEAGCTRYRELDLELPEYDTQGAIVQIDDDVRILKIFSDKFRDNKRSIRDHKTLRVILQERSSANKSS